MNVRTLLSVYAALVGIGGLIWLIAPTQSLGLYGVTPPDPVAVLLARYAGTMLIALGIMAWIGRSATASPARSALVLGITVANALGAVVCLLGALSPALNAVAWVPTASYALFTVLFVITAQTSRAEKPAVTA